MVFKILMIVNQPYVGKRLLFYEYKHTVWWIGGKDGARGTEVELMGCWGVWKTRFAHRELWKTQVMPRPCSELKRRWPWVCHGYLNLQADGRLILQQEFPALIRHPKGFSDMLLYHHWYVFHPVFSTGPGTSCVPQTPAPRHSLPCLSHHTETEELSIILNIYTKTLVC